METLEQFYLKNRKRHINTIRSILRYNKDLSEDIVQQAYMKALQYEDSYDSKRGSYNTWFNKILFNCLKTYQKSFGNTVSLDDNLEMNEDNIKYLLVLDRELSCVDNRKHKRILELFYRNGYTSNEVALSEHTTRTNVTTVCNRFKSKLSERYGLEL